jgi:hypothetical protein
VELPGESSRGVGEAATPVEKATGWVPCRRGGHRAEGEGRRVGAAPCHTEGEGHQVGAAPGGRAREEAAMLREKDALGEVAHGRCRQKGGSEMVTTEK